MRILTPILVALLLLPCRASADDFEFKMPGFKFQKSPDRPGGESDEQGDDKKGFKKQLKSEGVKGREFEDAWDLVENEKTFALLTARDKEVILRAIIAKFHEVEAINKKAGYKKMEVTDVDFKTFTVSGADFKKASEQYPQSYCVKETAKPAGPPVTNTEWQISAEQVPGKEYHKFFADNDYKLEPGRPEVQELQKQLDDAVKEIAPSDPSDPGTQGYITRVQIKSSASALRNTGDIPEWLDLSKARAMEARRFVAEYLKNTYNITVVIDPEKDLDYVGENGDGTSGPSGPYANDKKIYRNGILTEPYMDGPAGTAHDQYEKHKYVQVTLELSKFVKVPITTTEQPAPSVDTQMADMDIQVVRHSKSGVRHKTHLKRGHKHRLRKLWHKVKCIFTVKDECNPFKC